MVLYCCAFGCKSKHHKGSPLSFHSFPKDESRRRLWETKVRRQDFKATSATKICSKHFEEECFDREKFGGTWLKNTAVPTIFEFPPHLLTTPNPRKPVKRLCVEECHDTNGKRSKEGDIRDTTKATCSSETYVSTEAEGGTSSVSPRYHYIGDFNEQDIQSPRKAKKFLAIVKNGRKKHRNKCNALRMSKKRLVKKVTTLNSILGELRKKALVSESAANILQISLPGDSSEFLKRQLDGTTVKYPPELRTFALTLHFYSPKAYMYVRKTFNTTLPHPKTLKKWCRIVDGSPGFTSHSLSVLKTKVEESQKQGKKVVCALLVDEMSIRKHVEWDGSKFRGYVDFGTGLDNDELPVAKDALTFMLVAINGSWKLPIGYFLTNGLEAGQRANLIKTSLEHVHDTGVEVVSLTFDGTATNISSGNILGANLNHVNLETCFKHPVTNSDVFIFLDACHMLKLVRNSLASKNVLCDGNGDFIKWEYIVKLEEFQKNQGLHAATKLRKRHIEWQREKMKVKVAAQTLSKSVADALFHLDEGLKIPEFKGSRATVEFIRIINNLFDVLNSRNLLSKGYKAPIKPQNKDIIFSRLAEAKNYILQLKTVDGQSVLSTNRRTGFLGFLVCIESVCRLYTELTELRDTGMKFLLTYKLSQDHLETFFSSIRSKGGFNNNPTAQQFESAYKDLLIHHQVTAPNSSNCFPQDETSVLTVSSSRNYNFIADINHEVARTAGDSVIGSVNDFINVSSDHSYSSLVPVNALNPYISSIVEYISGFVQRKLVNVIKCESCLAAINNTVVDDNKFIKTKNMGGLTSPSSNIVKLCKIAEQTFRIVQAMGKLNHKQVMNILVTRAVGEVSADIFSMLQDHITEQVPLKNHRILLLKSVLVEYFRIRLFHHGKTITEEVQKYKSRSINTKLTLFLGH